MRYALLLVALAGCLDELGPQVGLQIRATCDDLDSDPKHDVHFGADIFEPIFNAPGGHCEDCHSPSGKNPFGLQSSGLDLSTYQTMLVGGSRSGQAIIVPGKPCESVLVQKVGTSPPFGGRMPLDGPPFLDDEQIRLISDWIAEGAHDN